MFRWTWQSSSLDGFCAGPTCETSSGWGWVLLVTTALQADPFSCVLVDKLEYFERNKEKSVLRLFLFWLSEMRAPQRTCLPGPTGSAQSKSSAASGSKGLSNSSYSHELLPKAKPTNFLQWKGCPTVLAKRMYYCSVVRRDHTFAQNNLLNLQERFGVTDVNLTACWITREYVEGVLGDVTKKSVKILCFRVFAAGFYVNTIALASLYFRERQMHWPRRLHVAHNIIRVVHALVRIWVLGASEKETNKPNQQTNKIQPKIQTTKHEQIRLLTL